MDIEKQLTNNIQEILSNTSPSVYYYLLVDSTFFNGVEKFTCTTKFLNQTYKNLYEDFSENLKNNGALLFQFNNDDIKNYYDDLQGIIEVGAFNFIVSDFDFENLSDHLEDLMEVIQPNGKSALFRFQDNFALDATLTSIDLKNFQKILSYKIKNWIWQSPDNKIYKVKNTVNYLKKNFTLKFSDIEFSKISQKLRPLRLMPLMKAFDPDLESLKFFELYDLVEERILAADGLAFKSFEDITLYSLLSYKFGDQFINEEPFKTAYLKMKFNEMSFQDSTDEIDLEQLDNWELNRKDKINV